MLTRRKRGSPGLTPWEGHAGRGRVGGTPELHIVVGVDDNLAPLPFARRRTGGGRARPPPDLLWFLAKEGFPPPASPLTPPHPGRRSRQAPHTSTGEALRPRALLRLRGAGRERSAAVPGSGRNQGMQRLPPPAPSLGGRAAGPGAWAAV